MSKIVTIIVVVTFFIAIAVMALAGGKKNEK